MRTHPLLTALLVCLLPAGAEADRCHLDPQPAATLLLPYFEVELANPNGRTTLFSINNAAETPTVAHLTIWTDWGVPTLDFDIFLTGYDVQTVNLRDLFVDGDIPNTADEAGDPSDDISPGGPGFGVSWDGVVPGCAGILPIPDANIGGALVDRLQQAHTGQPTAFDQDRCLGQNHLDDVARGWITIDNARRCSLLFPSSSGYFAGDDPVSSFTNQLWGDWFVIDPGGDLALGDTLVHIQADPEAADGSVPTFYAWAVDGGVDGREPLPDVFATRYLNGGAFGSGTHLLVWREPEPAPPSPAGRDCEAPQRPPLETAALLVFDEQENAGDLLLGGFGSSCVTFVCNPGQCLTPPPPPTYCFPFSTQRVSVGADLNAYFEFGWLYLDLGHNNRPPEDRRKQAWVVADHSADGRYSIGLGAVHLHSLCDPDDPVRPF